jgi:hypothetical protein
MTYAQCQVQRCVKSVMMSYSSNTVATTDEYVAVSIISCHAHLAPAMQQHHSDVPTASISAVQF